MKAYFVIEIFNDSLQGVVYTQNPWYLGPGKWGENTSLSIKTVSFPLPKKDWPRKITREEALKMKKPIVVDLQVKKRI